MTAFRRVRKSISKVTGVHGFFSGKGRRKEENDRIYSTNSFGAFPDHGGSFVLGMDANPLFVRRASADPHLTEVLTEEKKEVQRSSTHPQRTEVLSEKEKEKSMSPKCGTVQPNSNEEILVQDEEGSTPENPLASCPSLISPTLQRALSERPRQRRHTYSDLHWVEQTAEKSDGEGLNREVKSSKAQSLKIDGREVSDDSTKRELNVKPDACSRMSHKERQMQNYMKQFQRTKREFLPHGSVEMGELDQNSFDKYKATVTDALKFVVELYPSPNKMHAMDDKGSLAAEQLELDRLFSRLQGWHVRPGDWVIQQGKLCDRFVMIADGTFSDAAGDDVELGTYFNETSLILPTNSLHSVKSVSHGVVLTLLRKDLVDFIRLDVQAVHDGVGMRRHQSVRLLNKAVRRASVRVGWQHATDSKPHSTSSLTNKQLRRSSMNVSTVKFSHLNFPKLKQRVCFSDFQEIQTLGKGTFGMVKLVENSKNGKKFAMKVYKKAMMLEFGQNIAVEEESRLMSMIDNRFFAKIEVCYQDRDNLYLIMELISGGELTNLIYDEDSPLAMDEGGFPEEAARFYAANIVCMLEHLHKFHSIVYRDLKPENVILSSNGYLKLVDFGFARKLPHVDDLTGESSYECHDQCCSPNYVAPEVVKKSGHGFPVDWWSLGVLIFELASGALPFDHSNDIILFRKIKQGKYKWDSRFDPDENGDPYDNLRDVVKGLLDVDPGTRAQFAENLRDHAWFRTAPGFSWCEIANGQATPPHIPIDSAKPDNFDHSGDDYAADMDEAGGHSGNADWWPDGFKKI